MARRSEILTVYTAGVIQGVGVVTFPAAGAVFTSPDDYGLSSTEYGGMFIPQAIMAIVASLLGAGLHSRLGTKWIFLTGLFANLGAMLLLVTSQFFMKEHSVAYGMLLVATTCMGIGFGFTVPAINTFAAAFFPKKVDRAVLGLNALLGLGTALAPVFIVLFTGLGIWWGLPVVVGTLILTLILFSLGQPLNEDGVAGHEPAQKVKGKFPALFWIFALFALCYGICETMYGTWIVLYMKEHFRASATASVVALTMFWGTVTLGRILFASVGKWFPEIWVCRLLPLMVTAAFIASSCVPEADTGLGILTFALAGLGCSALLPLCISFGQKRLAGIAASVAGGLIAFYQIGYGIAAFGVGPLKISDGLSMSTIFGGTAIVALVLCGLAFAVTRKSSTTIQNQIQPTTQGEPI